MTLLRILRNLAVLVILTVGWLSVSPRAVAAQSTCVRYPRYCSLKVHCCYPFCCNRYTHMCSFCLNGHCNCY